MMKNIFSILACFILTACTGSEPELQSPYEWFYIEQPDSEANQLKNEIVGILIHKNEEQILPTITSEDIFGRLNDLEWQKEMERTHSFVRMNCVQKQNSAGQWVVREPLFLDMMFRFYGHDSAADNQVYINFPDLDKTFEPISAISMDDFKNRQLNIFETMLSTDRMIVHNREKSFEVDNLARFTRLVKENFPPDCRP